MTDVAFHFNVPDKLGYACRLLRKAHAAGGSVGVVAAPVVLQELDARLWSFSALDFVPHCLADAPAAPTIRPRKWSSVRNARSWKGNSQ